MPTSNQNQPQMSVPPLQNQQFPGMPPIQQQPFGNNQMNQPPFPGQKMPQQYQQVFHVTICNKNSC